MWPLAARPLIGRAFCGCVRPEDGRLAVQRALVLLARLCRAGGARRTESGTHARARLEWAAAVEARRVASPCGRCHAGPARIGARSGEGNRTQDRRATRAPWLFHR